MNRPTELTVEWFHTLPDDVKRKNDVAMVPEGIQ